MVQKLEIDVARMREEGERLEGTLDDAVLDLHDPYIKPFAGIRYDLDARVLGHELLVRGSLAQDFDAVCSRCGKDFDFTATVPDFLVSVEVNDTTDVVDLTDELRQSVLLAIPNFPRCSEDCPGILPQDEAAPDTRWSALDALAK